MNEQSNSKMYRALELPSSVDIGSLSDFLFCHGITHKITEESGRQILWVEKLAWVSQVEKYYKDWQDGLLSLPTPPKRRKIAIAALIRQIAWRQYPVTLSFIIISILVTVSSGFGQSFALLEPLVFIPFDIVSNGLGGDILHFGTLSTVLEHREYWRFFTPVFLHFSIIHLTFNMLWVFDFGKRIEAKQGGLHLLLLVITTGITSNITQYLLGSDSAIFGGFSGVIFGFLGYCIVREKVDKLCDFGILPAIYGFMLIYLVIGYSGILDGLFGGSIANSAHTGGLLSGAVIGLLAGLFLRKSKEET